MESNDFFAHFGDGNTAQIIHVKEHLKSETGIKVIRFILRPSKRIETMYNISEEQTQNGLIFREYPDTEVVFLERAANRIRCWIYTDFNSGPTPASRRFAELTEAINDTNRLLRSATAAKSRAYRELEIERQQQRMAIKLKTDMGREVARARGRVDGMDEGCDMSPGVQEQENSKK